MIYQGIVKNGVVVFDNGDHPPEGEAVRVETLPNGIGNRAPNPLLEGLLEIAGTIDGLPTDQAQNHDHYLHGQPRQ